MWEARGRKEDIIKTQAGETIDLNGKQEVCLNTQEEEDIWNLIKTDERVSSEKVNELLNENF